MVSTFDARMRELGDRVGWGVLAANVTFDQVYAHRQHEDLTLIYKSRGEGIYVPEEIAYRHPRGGGPKYLEHALFFHYSEYYESLAKDILEEPIFGMVFVGEVFRKRAENNAPKFRGFLEHSATLTVLDHGEVVHVSPAEAPRLSESEIIMANESTQLDRQHWYGKWPPEEGFEEMARRAKETNDWSKLYRKQMKETGITPQGRVQRQQVSKHYAPHEIRPRRTGRRTGPIIPSSGGEY